MGVKVGRSNRGWEASVCEVELTARGKEIFGKEKLVCLRAMLRRSDPFRTQLCFLGSNMERYSLMLAPQRINQMHKDIVFNYPAEVEPLGSSPRCEVQGMLISKRVITIQGHPEFNADIVSELLDARHKQGIFDDKTYEDAMDRVRREQDGVLVSGVFLKFLLDRL